MRRVFGFAGFSGSGKTTLVEQVVPHLIAAGLRVVAVKHTHHDFDLDHPGKDSYRLREAGCREVLLVGGRRWALLHELDDEREPTLEEMLDRLAAFDLALVEGFKHHPIPKLEVHRATTGKPMLFPDDPHIVCVATDSALDIELPQLDINRPDEVARFILEYFTW